MSQPQWMRQGYPDHASFLAVIDEILQANEAARQDEDPTAGFLYEVCRDRLETGR